MPERADTLEVIGLIMFAPLLYSMVCLFFFTFLRFTHRASVPLVELNRIRRHMHAFEPLLKLQASQRAHSRHRHVSLPRLTRSADVQIRRVQRQSLRFKEWFK